MRFSDDIYDDRRKNHLVEIGFNSRIEIARGKGVHSLFVRRLKYSRPRFATTKGVHDILEENIGTRGVGSIDLGDKPPSFVYLLAVSHITLHSIIVLIETQCLPDICIYSAITEFLQMDSSIKSFDVAIAKYLSKRSLFARRSKVMK